jgi:hypothetical protein
MLRMGISYPAAPRNLRALLFALVGCAPIAETPAPPHLAAAPVTPHVAGVAVAEAKPAPRSPYAYANVDPADDWTVGPPEIRATCDADLAAAGIVFKPASLPVHTSKKITCGAPQVITYRGSPAKISYQPSVLITCTMALALARFELILQDEAVRTFGKRVAKIHHVGTYACREMALYKGWTSEHSYANAIDLTDFVLENGQTVDVLKHYKGDGKQGSFLRAAATRAFRDELFSSVLTPYYDKLHANHFHLDLARFRSDGTSPQP